MVIGDSRQNEMEDVGVTVLIRHSKLEVRRARAKQYKYRF